MNSGNLNMWIRFSIFNLILVAIYGTLMRYKIGFEFPFFDQKFLLHAHSHFAFGGWISHTLIVLMINFLAKNTQQIKPGFYKLIIALNLVIAYGILISFTIQGYGVVSIIFSTASVLLIYVFAFCYVRDLNKLPVSLIAKKWFIAALFFYIFSSLGTFYLAFMMATKTFEQHQYIASVYFFLHFQYNGWFFFACLGLMADRIQFLLPDFKLKKEIFWLFTLSCFPAYFLSVLWAKLPVWVFIITIVAAFVQIYAWILLVKNIKSFLPHLKNKLPVYIKNLFLLVAICVSIKLLLQLFSTIPALSKLTFGFRPIVIAYLHLVLLGIISIFLLSYLFATEQLARTKTSFNAMGIFVAGVFLNEFLLMIQGITSFSYILLPQINEMLFVTAFIMLMGAVLLFISLKSVKHMLPDSKTNQVTF